MEILCGIPFAADAGKRKRLMSDSWLYGFQAQKKHPLYGCKKTHP